MALSRVRDDDTRVRARVCASSSRVAVSFRSCHRLRKQDAQTTPTAHAAISCNFIRARGNSANDTENRRYAIRARAGQSERDFSGGASRASRVMSSVFA